LFPLHWEFPGGRVEAGETDHAALTREIRERLAAHVQVGEHISSREMVYANYQLSFHLYECRLLSDWHNVGVADSRWVRSEDFESYEFTPADEASLAALLSL
jgi:8-oxo-dGTP diphosphatase